MAVNIAHGENADLYIVELAALLHDIADWKFNGGDESAGPSAARDWMERIGVDPECINHVCDIIATMSFKGSGVETEMATIEGKCVQDADRLDAIGAVGIARTFAFGGHFGRPIYDPEIEPILHRSAAEYKASAGPTINHFYEKLLLLKDRMQTTTGRKLAQGRHQFMEAFLAQFYSECEGKT